MPPRPRLHLRSSLRVSGGPGAQSTPQGGPSPLTRWALCCPAGSWQPRPLRPAPPCLANCGEWARRIARPVECSARTPAPPSAAVPPPPPPPLGSVPRASHAQTIAACSRAAASACCGVVAGHVAALVHCGLIAEVKSLWPTAATSGAGRVGSLGAAVDWLVGRRGTVGTAKGAGRLGTAGARDADAAAARMISPRGRCPGTGARGRSGTGGTGRAGTGGPGRGTGDRERWEEGRRARGGNRGMEGWREPASATQARGRAWGAGGPPEQARARARKGGVSGVWGGGRKGSTGRRPLRRVHPHLASDVGQRVPVVAWTRAQRGLRGHVMHGHRQKAGRAERTMRT